MRMIRPAWTSSRVARMSAWDGLTILREANAARSVTANDLLFGKHVLLRKGKKDYVVVTAK